MSASDLGFISDLKSKNAICHSFGKKSQSYAQNCSLQNEVAKKLLVFCESQKYQKIIDLGAGSGNIARNLMHNVDFLISIDNAPNMLALHPRTRPNIAQIKLMECDFECYDFSDDFDLIISSSALQWAKNLDLIFRKISDLVQDSNNLHKSPKFAFAIFTDKSLGELHSFLGTISPLKSSDEILAIAQKYFVIESKIKTFRCDFPTRNDVLAYLKNSALLGGGNLNFSDKKRLKYEFPYRTLNFEVLFIKN